jgi:nucleotide sugar dehydrogenase
MTVCVIGLGKIGLPLSLQIAKKRSVIGVDKNVDTLRTIESGKSPFPGEFGLEELLKETLETGRIRVQKDLAGAVTQSQVIVIVIPLVTNSENEPDFMGIDEVTKTVASNLQKGTLICFETTLPIGTTRNRFTNYLESISKLEVGKDFFVVFSPERVSSGSVFRDFSRYPKIVGGITDECGNKGFAFYHEVLDFDNTSGLNRPNGVWKLENAEAAEFVKLAETTYRDVNIALANTFEQYAYSLDLDFAQIRDAANSQPFSHIHEPGISVGGHCIPVYPHFYLFNDSSARLVQEARRVNELSPKRYLERLHGVYQINSKSNVLILGLSYRPGVKEHAYSGTLALANEVKSLGANVFIHDPLYSSEELEALKLQPWRDELGIHVVILHTASSEFKEFDFLQFTELEVILDGRNFYRQSNFPVPLV